MAGFEGTPSAFRAQPSVRSLQVRFYESLLLRNQGIDHLLPTFRNMKNSTSLARQLCGAHMPKSTKFPVR
jgi:hypothetical protein